MSAWYLRRAVPVVHIAGHRLRAVKGSYVASEFCVLVD